jgi:hypothetical protein
MGRGERITGFKKFAWYRMHMVCLRACTFAGLKGIF